MAKGDDNVQRKKNKVTRKKMSRKNDSATVSARIAAIIAAKKRRKSGKRSMCQGMCFSLPTPQDPYNERQGKPDITKKKKKKKNKVKSRDKEDKKPSPMSIDGVEKMDGPSKFLMSNLNEIENSFRKDGTYSEQHDKFLFTSTWGIEFWKCFLSGKDIVETSGMSSTVEQIAWIVSTAADAIAKREKDEEEDESIGNSPFLLYLVPSQSKASQVRSVCKALKGIGIHTVSLHQGASLDHQISGLKSVEPEFIVATPERLLEIVNSKGVDISGVSLLVIDELGSLCSSGYLDAVKSIKQAISSKHQSVVFNDSFTATTIPAVQGLLGRSINRVTVSDSVASQGSYIVQTVNVCSTEDKKLEKFAELLDSSSSKIIHIITKEESFGKIRALLKLKGISEVQKSRKPLAHLIDIEQLDTTVMRDFETVLLPDFFPSIEIYTQILTSMARESVHGVLQSFITKKEAKSYQAGPLVNVLESCAQNVPDPWKNLSVAMSD
ncbi:PREDICTED: DEAD-box ATP-dependent RNA helicase 40-like [Camelina sativa]|uniref:DEAD-box ATP-dependent RNA helicase 40-like n=1 Tax=Camelina sativa TaxID=90675 RepID=A0ABM0SQ57_CAMSA|nr:PREDICTED: DEAD-box ATP-dependent RNA helicase 40-like [Camelina sativa]